MSDQSVGSAQVSEGSAGASQLNDQQSESDTTTKQVDPKEYDRALKDALKFKAEYKKTQSEYQRLLEERKKDEEQALANQNEFKTLYERTKSELEKERQEKTSLKESFFLNQKMSAVRAAAIKSGLRGEAESDLDLLSLEGVGVEKTDHGRVIVHGADEYVHELKKTKPHWFSSKQVANVNSGGVNSAINMEQITPAMLVQVERSGDKVKYKQLYDQYLKQRAKK